MKNILRPCDCRDAQMTTLLNESAIAHNENMLMVVPNHVILKIGHTSIKISMRQFKKLAQWYLEPQLIEVNNEK